mmetsp:Transcript_37049/g.56809  ORF Transcript_37049/g.56809 Transcript_37049/m.56809 type:complete len:207 (-) Transcript_37049:3178-3798(-)
MEIEGGLFARRYRTDTRLDGPQAKGILSWLPDVTGLVRINAGVPQELLLLTAVSLVVNMIKLLLRHLLLEVRVLKIRSLHVSFAVPGHYSFKVVVRMDKGPPRYELSRAVGRASGTYGGIILHVQEASLGLLRLWLLLLLLLVRGPVACTSLRFTTLPNGFVVGHSRQLVALAKSPHNSTAIIRLTARVVSLILKSPVDRREGFSS